jgi:hypothetical protein
MKPCALAFNTPEVFEDPRLKDIFADRMSEKEACCQEDRQVSQRHSHCRTEKQVVSKTYSFSDRHADCQEDGLVVSNIGRLSGTG